MSKEDTHDPVNRRSNGGRDSDLVKNVHKTRSRSRNENDFPEKDESGLSSLKPQSQGDQLDAGGTCPEWKALDIQIGGHKLAMIDLGNGYILKSLQKPPRGTRELGFYQKVFDDACSDPDLIELKPFLAPFYGAEKKNGTTFLKLKNLTSQFHRPCVTDIKIGKVTYDQEATAEKRSHEAAKYPPMKQLGFRFSGMRVFDPKTQSNQQYENDYCLTLTESNMVTEGLGRFFGLQNGNLRRDAIRPVLSKLKRLESWFLKQKKFSFIASSLLIVYEGLRLDQVKVDRASSSEQDCSPVLEDTGKNEKKSKCGNGKNLDSDLSINRTAEETEAHSSVTNEEKSSIKRFIDHTDAESEPRSKKLKLSTSDVKGNGSHGPHNSCLQEQSDSLNPGMSNSQRVADVCLIDFAHVFPAKKIDENFLFGLQNLINSLETLVTMETIKHSMK
ncbi:inositol polyphosphate multikinase [Aplysia californica]|uniref:Kinase n=1 Tax=Aplysia californica TaxID=6500 RepID=A0ABM0JJJ9_APLCA|nr:inositol polyphosphate multikinase [Aplysia californica]